MEGYLIWLAYLLLAIIAFSSLQLQMGRNKRLQKDCRRMQTDVKRLQEELRVREKDIDHLQRDQSQLLKWKDRSSELEKELRTTKQKQDYMSAQRLQYLEDYLVSEGGNPAVQFLGTFPPRYIHSFDDYLHSMLERAEFEVVIVSPWIKRRVWDRIKVPLHKFARRGGKLRIFMRGSESDYNLGLSDDIRAEVLSIGGEVVSVRQLHAKIYLVDGKEAIIASSNLTKGGMEENYEAGIWLSDPAVLKDISAFVDDLYQCRQP